MILEKIDKKAPLDDSTHTMKLRRLSGMGDREQMYVKAVKVKLQIQRHRLKVKKGKKRLPLIVETTEIIPTHDPPPGFYHLASLLEIAPHSGLVVRVHPCENLFGIHSCGSYKLLRRVSYSLGRLAL